MTSSQEFSYLFIREAAFELMRRGVPALLAENQIGFLVRRMVEQGTIMPGTRVELLFGRKLEAPVMCFVRQAVHLRMFLASGIRDEWVRIQIPRHEIERIAPPPMQPPAANSNVRVLADGTTGQPLPSVAPPPPGAQEKPTIRDRANQWFAENAMKYHLEERGEKTRMYADAARALSIGDGTAKAYLSPLVNGKDELPR